MSDRELSTAKIHSKRARIDDSYPYETSTKEMKRGLSDVLSSAKVVSSGVPISNYAQSLAVVAAAGRDHREARISKILAGRCLCVRLRRKLRSRQPYGAR
jgi:hypothetical protein